MPFSKRQKGKHSLVRHLTTSLVMVVIASSLAISSMIFIVLYEKAETQFEQRANEALSHLANSLESYLWHMEEESVVSLCETFTTIDIVVYINVADHRGNTIYSYGEIVEGDTILKERGVSYDNIAVGLVKLGLTPAIFKEKVYETTWISLLSLLSMVIILGIFTKMVLNKNLRRPLGDLIERIEAMAAGEYTEQDQEGNLLEMQRILSKFNEMAGQIRSRENELRLSEEKYRSLFETSIEGIMMADSDFRISQGNKVMADMLGLTEAEMVGMLEADIIFDDELKSHHMEMEKRRSGLSSQYERRFKRKDGDIVWAIISSSPQFNEKGEFQGSFSMITDITALRTAQAELKLAYDEMEQRVVERTEELNQANRLLTSEIHIRKQTEKEIIKAKEAAEEATKAKSEFLANMSHEIRTPMNAIIGMTHLAKMTDLTAAQKDYLTKIDISARSLLGIINDVLDMSKIEAGMLNVETVGFKLDHVLEQLTSIVSPRANEKQLEFLIDVGKDVPPAIVGDSMRLSQILINLCNNAIKFTEEGAVVVGINVLEQDDETVKLRFSVRDDGIGIEPELIEKLFQPFTQADASTTRKYGGTGLGLNLCNQLVGLMGGTIGAESEPGQGSLFWFEIAFSVHRRDDSLVVLPSELQGLSTLVVDDNPTSRIILKGMLEQMGLEVDLAKSGYEAIEILRNTPREEAYKLLVIDWRMPGMDGLETAGNILGDASIPSKPPMFMVSAYGNATLVKKTNEMGFKGLLFKPVNQSFLFNLIIETLGKDMVVKTATANNDTIARTLAGAKVLLVEDNEINRQVAEEILSSVGIKTFEALNGRDALEFLEDNDVDLVLMDIQMPVMDGHEATVEIRKQKRFESLPIVAMTAHAMVEDVDKSRESGMDDHITKPFDPDDLFEVLVRWIKPPTKGEEDKGAEVPGVSNPGSLPDVMEGIDIELGLKRSRGNEKLYKNLLLLLDEKYADAGDKIDAALEEGRREDAVSLAHSVKGTSGMLGAMELFVAAGDLEDALGTDSRHEFDVEFSRFAKELGTVIESIRVLKDVSDSETTLKQSSETSNRMDLLSALDEMKEPLKLGAPVVCRENAQVIRSLVWPARLESDVQQLLLFIAEYDFKKARGLIEEIEKEL